MTALHPDTAPPETDWGVVFDGDDTLWITEPLYDQARESARKIVAQTGISGEEWERLQRTLDVQNVATLGYSAERFPTSCVEAYDRLCRFQRRIPDSFVAGNIREAAATVFLRDPELVPHAKDVLALLRERGNRLALFTKGDVAVQRRRVERSGLREYFRVVRIVGEKTPEEIRDLAAELGVALTRAWMVGNSLRSDVLPALQAGIGAIWIEAHVWEYERMDEGIADKRVIVASSIADVPAIVATGSTEKTATDKAKGLGRDR